MKVVILAGGYGTRISEESRIRPKPLVEIGGYPILWHIMKIYAAHNINEFIICCGYKGHVIKAYFANYLLYQSDLTFNLRDNQVDIHNHNIMPWKVTLIDTGEATLKGGRLKRVKQYIGNKTFCMTYGDGVSDINITELIKFHREQKKLATLTAVQPPDQSGVFDLTIDLHKVPALHQEPQGKKAWVNGGFFVLEPGVMDYIEGDTTDWEQEPLEGLARDGELSAYRHHGFWYPMDTLKDRAVLEQLWESDKAPWKIW